MTIKTVVEEYEAKLEPAGAQRCHGKIECKTYGNGERALKVRVRDIGDIAAEYPLRLFVNDALIGELVRTGKKAELNWSSRQGDSIPTVSAADETQIRSGDLALASGIFYED